MEGCNNEVLFMKPEVALEIRGLINGLNLAFFVTFVSQCIIACFSHNHSRSSWIQMMLYFCLGGLVHIYSLLASYFSFSSPGGIFYFSFFG
jgi:hypothetical protein